MLIDVKLIAVVLVFAAFCFGQQARKIAPARPIKPTPISKSTAKGSPVKASPVRGAVISKTTYRPQATMATRVPAGRYRVAYRPPVRVTYVQAPTSDRYREIQQALADKGYYAAEVNGTWDPASVEALNRFKTDQKLRADGKLCSLSLIALGLGPRYEAVTPEQLSSATPIPADQQ